MKRFGNITEDYLLYGRATSSYGAHLPTDYYHGFVKENVPKKDKKWFIRPHHVEVLTSKFALHQCTQCPRKMMCWIPDITHTIMRTKTDAHLRRNPMKTRLNIWSRIYKNWKRSSSSSNSIDRPTLDRGRVEPWLLVKARLLFILSSEWVESLISNSKAGWVYIRKTKEIPNKTKTGLIVSAYEGILYKLRREEKSM